MSGSDGLAPLAIAIASGLISLAGAIFGAITNERYKSHRSKLAVAAAFFAEIKAVSELTREGRTAEQFAAIADQLEAGGLIAFPRIFAPEPHYGPIFDKYVDRLGLLRSSDATDVVLFYNYLFGIRYITRNLVSGAWSDLPNGGVIMAAQIRTGLEFWRKCEAISLRLLPSLEKIGGSKFNALGVNF